MKMYIKLKLKSDAAFGSGEGVAGLVDEEVEHDHETGLPFLRGRILKGLLVEECANILYALEGQNVKSVGQLKGDAGFLFGHPGSTLSEGAHMHVGQALLPKELRYAVEQHVKRDELTPHEVLDSLTAIRRQTSIDEKSGAPKEGSLRSMRVVLRDISFTAPLSFDSVPGREAIALLAACVLSLRRAGLGRNRGLGRLKAVLLDEKKIDVTKEYYQFFCYMVKGEAV